MIVVFDFESADHTSGTLREYNDASMLGQFSIKRLLARVDGNAGNATISIYVAPGGLAGGLTSEQMARYEVYSNTAVAAAADPSPELNVTGEPIPFKLNTGWSIYAYHVGDVNPTTATVEVYL